MNEPDDRGGWRRLRSLFGPDLTADVNDEITFHLDMRARDLAASPDAAPARAEAERLFGDVDGIRGECLSIDERRHHRKHRREVLGDLMQDFTYALRGLRKSPAFTLMAAGCVALGVCVATTIFSAVHSILLRPLPYPDAGQLVAVYARRAEKNWNGVNISYPDYVSWRDGNHSFASIATFNWSSHALSGDGEAERVDGADVTASLFPTLGVAPILGRTIVGAEETTGRDRVVVLSHGLWQRRYGGDTTIVGRAITLDGLPYEVIGVMPPGFNFPEVAQLWVPFVQLDWMQGRGNRGIAGAIARLKPGRPLAAAQADLGVMSKRLEREFPRENGGWDAQALALREDLVGELRRPLLVFQGAVVLVLLIACANVANLMLARGSTRQRDLAVRLALGATRRRIAGQLFAEALSIAAVGGTVGAASAVLGVKLLRLALPSGLPGYMSIDLDRSALLFAVASAVLTGLLFGLMPAVRAARVDPNGWLRQGSRGEVGGGRQASRLRSALVVGEVALSLVLLVGATLLVKSYRSLADTDLGFDANGVVIARVSLPRATYGDLGRRRATWQSLYERLAAIPGVTVAASAAGTPFSGWNVQAAFSVDGRPARKPGDELVVHYQNVSPDFFNAIGVPLLRGRMFTTADRDTSAHIGVINQTLAEREFPGQDPIGKRIRQGDETSTSPWVTVVGVVGTFRHYRLPQPMGNAIYYPQLADPAYTQVIALRTSLDDPSSVMPAVRTALREIDPALPAFRAQTLHEVVSRSLWRQRFQGQVLGAFAVLALGLALVGIYGVISYTVALRTRELGVRMALGARRRHVLQAVVGQGVRLAAAGVVLGVGAAFALTGVVKSLLYEVSPTDPTTFVAVPAVLIAVAALASLLPALRATRVNPVEALRAD